jgi:hypothetical protein
MAAYAEEDPQYPYLFDVSSYIRVQARSTYWEQQLPNIEPRHVEPFESPQDPSREIEDPPEVAIVQVP